MVYHTPRIDKDRQQDTRLGLFPLHSPAPMFQPPASLLVPLATVLTTMTGSRQAVFLAT
jgi:hypothetical protein